MIYLDHQATTPLLPEARAAMLPFLDGRFANPHSSHRPGREAKVAVEIARVQGLDALLAGSGVRAEEGRLIFTGGATEALNWAIKGTWERVGYARPRIVTSAIEHSAVLDTCRHLARHHGAELIELPVSPDGLVDAAEAAATIDERVGLVAIMQVNNEIGTVQPVAEIGRHARAAGAIMLCDAVQGMAKLPVPVEACDLVAVSGHKLGGPKGVGALWVRRGAEPAPLLHGGGQEAGLRSGTLSPMLCAGFGAAAAASAKARERTRDHLLALSDVALAALGPGWLVNGSTGQRWPGNLNVRRLGLDANRLISEVRNVAFSAGSACASGSGRPSHVLAALGLDASAARSSIRLGFGPATTSGEVEQACALINQAAARQRLAA